MTGITHSVSVGTGSFASGVIGYPSSWVDSYRVPKKIDERNLRFLLGWMEEEEFRMALALFREPEDSMIRACYESWLRERGHNARADCIADGWTFGIGDIYQPFRTPGFEIKSGSSDGSYLGWGKR